MQVLPVSVAGCLGYDVLARGRERSTFPFSVSVAGCLGYDVLGGNKTIEYDFDPFQLLVV